MHRGLFLYISAILFQFVFILKKFLKNRQEQQQCSPYETITNGIRTYDGHPIPAYAKPRPSAAHIWNPVTNEWTR